jgi:transcriptional regulator with GAF, ATPase, and Fis domain
VLQESEFERVGGIKTIKVDVRLVAATNRDLHAEVAAGASARTSTTASTWCPSTCPAARAPRGHPALVDHFIAKFNERLKKQIVGIEPDAVRALVSYHWPGNIRELENVIERTMLFCEGPTSGPSICRPSSDW